MAVFVAFNADGPAALVIVPRRAPPLDPAQALARRNALWLWAIEEGMTDPITGLSRLYSGAELAALWGVTRRTVNLGLAAARQVRDLLNT